jgi:hypothetical protein
VAGAGAELLVNRVGDNLICAGVNEGVIRAFVTNEVEYLIVGGLAVSWYCEERQADDLDILVNPTTENSQRISLALSELKIPIGVHEFAAYGKQLQLKTNFYADIISPAINGISYIQARTDAIKARCFNMPVLLPSLENLIRLKEEAAHSAENGAAKHMRDIALLKQCLCVAKNT